MNRRKALLALHLGALFFGLSGIFGKLALAAPIVIVFGRALFAVAALGLFTQRGAAQVRPNWQRCLALAGAGLLLGGHWWSFFIAIKVAGVAVATLGFASFPAFTVLLEGLLFKERVSRGEWAVVGLVCLGLVLVTPHFDFASEATLGLAWAVLSGLLFALFRSLKDSAIVFSGVPLALTGGVAALTVFHSGIVIWKNVWIVDPRACGACRRCSDRPSAAMWLLLRPRMASDNGRNSFSS